MILNNLKIKTETLLLFFWILILGSINSIAPSYIDYKIILSDNFFSIEHIIFLSKLLRFLIPFFLIFFLIAVMIRKKISFNLFNITFILYSLWQIFLYLHYEKYFLQINGLQLATSTISVILILSISNNKFFYEVALKILLTLVFLYSAYFTFFLIIEFFEYDTMLFLYSSFTLEAETKTLDMANPRITGVARSLTIIFFFIFFLKRNKPNSFLSIFLILISTIIYATQSRGAFIGMLSFFFIYLFFFKEKLKDKIKLTFLLLLLPIILWNSIIETKLYLNDLTITEEAKTTFQKNKLLETPFQKDRLLETPFQKNRLLETPKIGAEKDITSGRIIIWKKTFDLIKEKKIIFGLGPQADRIYLAMGNMVDEQKAFWVNNVSNIYLYSFLCAGIFGLISIFLLNFLLAKIIFKSVFIQKINNLTYTGQFSVATITFLCLRGFFENSYGHFGIDFCLIVICYNLLKNELTRDKT